MGNFINGQIFFLNPVFKSTIFFLDVYFYMIYRTLTINLKNDGSLLKKVTH
jgi:hypothetical protein